ncbi:hypothetical protein ACMG5N_11830, partial [Escherichia coli]
TNRSPSMLLTDLLHGNTHLVWFGEIGVHEFAYLVKNYVAAVN